MSRKTYFKIFNSFSYSGKKFKNCRSPLSTSCGKKWLNDMFLLAVEFEFGKIFKLDGVIDVFARNKSRKHGNLLDCFVWFGAFCSTEDWYMSEYVTRAWYKHFYAESYRLKRSVLCYLQEHFLFIVCHN